MLPDKKKNLLTIGGVILFVIIIVIITALVTSFIKKRNQKPNIDNAYPKNAYYVGIKTKDSNYEKLVILDKDFKVISNDINSFSKIKDIITKDNQVIFYSDTLNVVAYNEKENNYYVKEKEEYLSDVNEVKLSNIGIAYLNNNNDLVIRYYDNYKEEEIIDHNVKDGLTLINDSIYYNANEVLKKYNLKDKTLNAVEDIEKVDNEEISKEGYERIIKIK